MGFSELEFWVKSLRGAAPTPLRLPYPFRTSTKSTRMEAERDKREVPKFLHFERSSIVSCSSDLDVRRGS